MALLVFMTRRFLKFVNAFAVPYRLLLEMGMTTRFLPQECAEFSLNWPSGSEKGI